MSPHLRRLIEEARNRPVTAEDLHQQEISFAYRNASPKNPNVTREMAERSAAEHWIKNPVLRREGDR